MKKYNAEDILTAREKRVELQNTLINTARMPLLVMRVNYPGLVKDNQITKGIIDIVSDSIERRFLNNIDYKTLQITAEGPIYMAVITETAVKIKEASIEIEETHPLGRFVDIDIYDLDGIGLSRTELGYENRRCYLCDDMAQCCVRSRKHDVQDIIAFINDRYKEYVENWYGQNV